VGFPQVLPIPAVADTINILNGYQTFAATTGATTVITIPASQTWQGSIGVACSCAEVAAGAVSAQALAVITIAGAGAIPAAGTIMAVNAQTGANAATGLVGNDSNANLTMPFIITAPAGNSVTVQATVTIAGTSGRVDVTASGEII
jgi:hypothetical protein